MTDDQPAIPAIPPWWSARRMVLLAMIADAAGVSVLVAVGADGWVTAVLVFVFLALGPGLAVTGFLRLPDAVTELAIAVPLSLALDVVVAGGMSLVSAWQPAAALVVSAMLTCVALGIQLRRILALPAAEG